METSENAKKYPDYVQAVEDFLAAKPRAGDLISHEWLDEHLGLDKDARHYSIDKMHRVGAFRKMLLTVYQIDTKSMIGQGYYVISPKDQTEIALADTITHIRKASLSGLSRCVNTRRAELTESGIKENELAITALSAIGPALAGQLRIGKKGGERLSISE